MTYPYPGIENGADRIRTSDRLVMSQALYLAKLQPLILIVWDS